jgi:hypothetical protein
MINSYLKCTLLVSSDMIYDVILVEDSFLATYVKYNVSVLHPGAKAQILDQVFSQHIDQACSGVFDAKS